MVGRWGRITGCLVEVLLIVMVGWWGRITGCLVGKVDFWRVRASLLGGRLDGWGIVQDGLEWNLVLWL